MKIGIIGHGKMGKAIEAMAIEQGHQVVWIIRDETGWESSSQELNEAEVALEFTKPEFAFANIKRCLESGIPVVSGTTGWLDKMDEMKAFCIEQSGAFFYASNFSIGVNIFFEINEKLAGLLAKYPQYKPEIEEIHHTQKLDAPSGTAISIAQGIMSQNPDYTSWINSNQPKKGQIAILSKREGSVPGTHLVSYHSEIDSIEITHTAHSRKGFVAGALLAAGWLKGKTGVFGMKDLLNDKQGK